MMRESLALAPGAPAAARDDDWLTMAEADLEAMQAEALALFRAPQPPVLAARATASLALLHQLAVARSVVGALGQSQAEARAAMRSDHVLGYLFGLASGAAGEERDARGERRVAGILMMLHGLAYGRAAAEALTAELLECRTGAVGAGFAAGMIAAVQDLHGLERWRQGEGGGLPGGMLDGLRWPGWHRDGATDRRH